MESSNWAINLLDTKNEISDLRDSCSECKFSELYNMTISPGGILFTEIFQCINKSSDHSKRIFGVVTNLQTNEKTGSLLQTTCNEFKAR